MKFPATDRTLYQAHFRRPPTHRIRIRLHCQPEVETAVGTAIIQVRLLVHEPETDMEQPPWELANEWLIIQWDQPGSQWAEWSYDDLPDGLLVLEFLRLWEHPDDTLASDILARMEHLQ